MTLEDLVKAATSETITDSDKCESKRVREKTVKCGAC